jgi:hypothetical protein
VLTPETSERIAVAAGCCGVGIVPFPIVCRFCPAGRRPEDQTGVCREQGAPKWLRGSGCPAPLYRYSGAELNRASTPTGNWEFCSRRYRMEAMREDAAISVMDLDVGVTGSFGAGGRVSRRLSTDGRSGRLGGSTPQKAAGHGDSRYVSPALFSGNDHPGQAVFSLPPLPTHVRLSPHFHRISNLYIRV